MDELCLFVNGPYAWYENLYESFKNNGKTWLQQSRAPKEAYISILKKFIETRGFFYTFGYVQAPYSKVQYVFKISEIKCDKNKLPPPDESAPKFSDYDIKQGKCLHGKYVYPLWLKVIEIKKIKDMDFRQFINFNTNKPMGSVGGVVALPVIPPEGLITEIESSDSINTNEEEKSINNSETGTLGIEKDIKEFIVNNLIIVEEGLVLDYTYDISNEKLLKIQNEIMHILCRDKYNNYVVIFIKEDHANLNLYSQIKCFIALFKENLSNPINVRGVIIASDFTDEIIITSKYDADLKLLKFKMKYDFDEVFSCK